MKIVDLINSFKKNEVAKNEISVDAKKKIEKAISEFNGMSDDENALLKRRDRLIKKINTILEYLDKNRGSDANIFEFNEIMFEYTWICANTRKFETHPYGIFTDDSFGIDNYARDERYDEMINLFHKYKGRIISRLKNKKFKLNGTLLINYIDYCLEFPKTLKSLGSVNLKVATSRLCSVYFYSLIQIRNLEQEQNYVGVIYDNEQEFSKIEGSLVNALNSTDYVGRNKGYTSLEEIVNERREHDEKMGKGKDIYLPYLEIIKKMYDEILTLYGKTFAEYKNMDIDINLEKFEFQVKKIFKYIEDNPKSNPNAYEMNDITFEFFRYLNVKDNKPEILEIYKNIMMIRCKQLKSNDNLLKYFMTLIKCMGLADCSDDVKNALSELCGVHNFINEEINRKSNIIKNSENINESSIIYGENMQKNEYDKLMLDMNILQEKPIHGEQSVKLKHLIDILLDDVNKAYMKDIYVYLGMKSDYTELSADKMISNTLDVESNGGVEKLPTEDIFKSSSSNQVVNYSEESLPVDEVFKSSTDELPVDEVFKDTSNKLPVDIFKKPDSLPVDEIFKNNKNNNN